MIPFAAVVGAARRGVRASASAASAFFSDGFETGDTLHTENGALWTDTKAVNLLNPRTGAYAAEFFYPGEIRGEDSSSELHFELPTLAQEVFIEWYVRIPTNFYHRPEQADGFGSDNNKFLFAADLNEGEAGPGDGLGYHVKSIIEFRAQGADVVGDSVLRPTWGTNQDRGGVLVSGWGVPVVQEFIVAADRGFYVRYRAQFRASDPGQSNGIVRVWKNDTLMSNHTTLANESVDGTSNGYKKFYFMGYANSGYTDDTYFYLDDVKFYTSDPGWS